MAKAKPSGDLRGRARDRAGLGRHVGLTGGRPPYALEAAEVVAAMGSDETVGLSPAEASALAAVRREQDHQRKTALHMGGGLGAAAATR